MLTWPSNFLILPSRESKETQLKRVKTTFLFFTKTITVGKVFVVWVLKVLFQQNQLLFEGKGGVLTNFFQIVLCFLVKAQRPNSLSVAAAGGPCLWTTQGDGEVKLRMTDSGLSAEKPLTINDMFTSAVKRFGDFKALCWSDGAQQKSLNYREYYQNCRTAAKSFLKVESLRSVGIFWRHKEKVAQCVLLQASMCSDSLCLRWARDRVIQGHRVFEGKKKKSTLVISVKKFSVKSFLKIVFEVLRSQTRELLMEQSRNVRHLQASPRPLLSHRAGCCLNPNRICERETSKVTHAHTGSLSRRPLQCGLV